MEADKHRNTAFFERLDNCIDARIPDETFGVSELAGAIGMSRSNLLRKVQKAKGMSVSQYIRLRRLEHARKLLGEGGLSISEVAFRSGFNSASYFSKCFREHYGHSPGEDGREAAGDQSKGAARPIHRWGLLLAAVAMVPLLFFILRDPGRQRGSSRDQGDKSIAVLPFINDSPDSTNLYIVNGLMEAILEKLQKIGELQVVSRTSVEKYRQHKLTIPEIARELGVHYIVEGSGQKRGDELLLHVQLIDARADRHLWAQRYRREAGDIFGLQLDVASRVAEEIEVILTPEEQQRLGKVPTTDLVAYDHFLKGMEHFYRSTREGLMEAIPYFLKAIELDSSFARAHANTAISYYMIDFRQQEKQHSKEIGFHALRAMALDPYLPQSLIARAMLEMQHDRPADALPFLEDALEYNPNSMIAINLLSDYYVNVVPHSEKYLEYALLGIRLGSASSDSLSAAYTFLHTGNALIQCGFLEEGEAYIQRMLGYDPGNIYGEMLMAYLPFARGSELGGAQQRLQELAGRFPGRIEPIEELAKLHYYLGSYDSAVHYFEHMDRLRDQYHIDVYRGEHAKFALALRKTGREQDAAAYIEDYLEWISGDRSGYRELSLGAYHAFRGDKAQAMRHLEAYAAQDNFNYWIVRFIGIDPLFEPLLDHPGFQPMLHRIEATFMESHIRLKALLEEKHLL